MVAPTELALSKLSTPAIKRRMIMHRPRRFLCTDALALRSVVSMLIVRACTTCST